MQGHPKKNIILAPLKIHEEPIHDLTQSAFRAFSMSCLRYSAIGFFEE